MYRFLLGATLVVGLPLGACGTVEDDRPATLEYVTATILAPACANAQCHSAFHQAKGYAFDSVEHARTTIDVNGLVSAGDPEGSFLLTVMTRPGADNASRMPYDEPLPEPDIALISRWIADGAPGLGAP
ncbi:MAG: hypothetical protein H6Q90_6847 [Deltaproteobacteria bacterium]|nr:hypothetical protein [Deltaproteobacteria bacterium]